MANTSQHTPNFSVNSLSQDHFEIRTLLVTSLNTDRFHLCETVRKVDPIGNFLQSCIADNSSNANMISLGDLEFGMRQLVSKISVIGYKD